MEVDVLYKFYDKIAADLRDMTQLLVSGKYSHCAETLGVLFDKLGGRVDAVKGRDVKPSASGKKKKKR
jgi:hypothetical protein